MHHPFLSGYTAGAPILTVDERNLIYGWSWGVGWRLRFFINVKLLQWQKKGKKKKKRRGFGLAFCRMLKKRGAYVIGDGD